LVEKGKIKIENLIKMEKIREIFLLILKIEATTEKKL
jgi:hypothetical protein